MLSNKAAALAFLQSVMPFVEICIARAPTSFSPVLCKGPPPAIPCYRFFHSEILAAHLWPSVFHRGVNGGRGGAVALPAFNRDALTNRPRIRLLDKASFILTLCAPQGLCAEIERAGDSTFFRGVGGEDSWHTVPGCALFDHA